MTRLSNPGFYELESLPTDGYSFDQSYMGSFDPEYPELLRVHEQRDEELVGLRSVDGEARQYMNALEAMVTGKELPEFESITGWATKGLREYAGIKATKWEVMHRTYVRNNPDTRHRDIFVAAYIASWYVVGRNTPHIRVLTAGPRTNGDTVRLRQENNGFVADLAGFGIEQRAGGLVVRAIVEGKDFQPRKLPLMKPSEEHSTLFVLSKAVQSE